jgi:type VI secretion system protein ImpH
MAEQSWAPSDPVSPQESELRAYGPADADPITRDFYLALRKIEVAHRTEPRLGEGLRVSEEPVRLGQRPTLAFEGSAILARHASADGRPPRIEVGFFGVFGPNGPLPLHITEYVHQRIQNNRDYTLARFLDIFHHRMLTLFYRAWANAQPVVNRDRPQSDRFANYIACAIGQGSRPKGTAETDIDRFSRYMAAHFTGQTRHPEGLEKVVSTFFGIPAKVHELLGEWLRVPDEFCWRLTHGAPRAPQLGRLGEGTRVGRYVWERQFKFRLELGPMSRAQYDRLMPHGSDVRRLVALVRRYLGHELSWEVQLVLHEPDMAPMQLGAARLSRNAYLVRERISPEKRWQDFVYDPLQQAG